MGIVSVMGSPRRQGNTATVLSMAEAALKPRHSVERIDLGDYRVNGCLGCLACRKSKTEPGCRQQDDGPALLDRIVAAAAVIYATPLYCWGFSAQLKALIDRHFSLLAGTGADDSMSLVPDKPMALLVTCAGPEAGNADLIQEVFQRMGRYLGSRIVGRYVVPFCTTPDRLPPAAAATAGRLAADLTRALTA